MVKPFIRVLMIDDDEEDFYLTHELLKKIHRTEFILKWAPSYAAGMEQIRTNAYDAVLVDYNLGEHSGIDFVREAVAEGYPAPFILQTGHGSYEVDVEAMHTGVAGYIPKSEATPFLIERMIRYAIERKAKEEELRVARDQARESEERLFVALATTPISIFTQDCDLRFTWANNPLFGFAPDKLIGKRDDELLPPEDAAPLLQQKRAVIETGVVVKTELNVKVRDDWQHIILALEPMFDENGAVAGITGAVLDRTEEHQLEARQFHHEAEMEVKRRLLEHREMERQEIARNLHDGPIQDLICLFFPLDAAQSLCDNPKVGQVLENMRGDMERLVRSLRDICNELRPTSLDAFGLEAAIRSHARDFQARHSQIQVTLDLNPHDCPIPPGISLGLFRIYQEAMNNAARHAKASQIEVYLLMDNHRVTLEICDNGVGFDLPEDFVNLARQRHFGLIGMKERVDGMGGDFHIRTKRNEGATFIVSVPLGGETSAKK